MPRRQPAKQVRDHQRDLCVGNQTDGMLARDASPHPNSLRETGRILASNRIPPELDAARPDCGLSRPRPTQPIGKNIALS